jgi:hypothetical protein
MGQVKSKSASAGRRAIVAQNILPEVPDNVRFRILIIGRANAGKTSILQRVCDTTESPEIYRLGPWGERNRVRSRSQWGPPFDLIIRSGSTRGITRGWADLFLLVMLIMRILLPAWPPQRRGRNYIRESRGICFP